MNDLSIFVLKALRKLYAKIFGECQLPPLQHEKDPDKASEMIYQLLSQDKPCMIARFGSTEMSAIINYLGVNSQQHSIWKFIQGKQPEWWWNKNIMNQMQQWSGFFPPTPENMQRFGKMMIEDTKEVDLLGSWLKQENLLTHYLISCSKYVWLDFLIPFLSNNPWSRILQGKKVLVIHPFAETIRHQYNQREKLFLNTNVLPTFQSLNTIKAVQSLGGDNTEFKDWFKALKWMKDEMDKTDYEICLIGCGAYGFPLAAHAKRKGKKAIHLGGALQLLFGIRGRRWENPHLNKDYDISSYMNEFWVRPSAEEKPQNSENVENACYW